MIHNRNRQCPEHPVIAAMERTGEVNRFVWQCRKRRGYHA